jgi:hypothetical protein
MEVAMNVCGSVRSAFCTIRMQAVALRYCSLGSSTDNTARVRLAALTLQWTRDVHGVFLQRSLLPVITQIYTPVRKNFQ